MEEKNRYSTLRMICTRVKQRRWDRQRFHSSSSRPFLYRNVITNPSKLASISVVMKKFLFIILFRKKKIKSYFLFFVGLTFHAKCDCNCVLSASGNRFALILHDRDGISEHVRLDSCSARVRLESQNDFS